MSPGTALITGASSGIGAAFALRLAGEGYNLVLVARREDRLADMRSELSAAAGVQVSTVQADLATDSGVARVEAVVAAADDLTLLINNAGFGIAGKFFSTPVEAHDRMHRLHVLATMRLTHAALCRMVPAARGAIINVSSVAAFTASPGSVSYSATKHWMNSFTEGIYLDLAIRKSPVRVQALCPGFTFSEFHDVMPMDRSAVPKPWWTSAEDVVSASLRGLERNELFVIPGWRYKLLMAMARTVPNAWSRRFTLRFARRLKKNR